MAVRIKDPELLRRRKEAFIEIHNNKFKDQYNFEETIFTDAKTTIEFKCNLCNNKCSGHPQNLKYSRSGGCECVIKKQDLEKRENDFIEKAKAKWGERYSYDNLGFEKGNIQVNIICLECNQSFKQRPDDHKAGKNGCPMCGNKKMNTEIFKKRGKLRHDGKYNYNKSEYKGSNVLIEIECPHHGSFFQIANNHINTGNGCPNCHGKR